MRRFSQEVASGRLQIANEEQNQSRKSRITKGSGKQGKNLRPSA